MSSPSRERSSVLVTHRFELCTALVIGALGLGLGLWIPADQTLAHPYDKLVSVSSENSLTFKVQNDPVEKHRQILQVSGWLYFLAWSLSFYPQFLLNRRTKSVVGFSLDFAACNLLGFLCYSIFNAAFYWDDSVQQEYRWGCKVLALPSVAVCMLVERNSCCGSVHMDAYGATYHTLITASLQ